jgi:hypothetical protein
MYAPIPDVCLEEEATTEESTRAAAQVNVPRQKATTQSRRALTVLTGTAWIAMLCFGFFASGHYVRRAWRGEWHLWDLSDRHLYRGAEQPVANGLMVAHMAAGSLLMLAGPVQLLPFMRRHYLWLHRWIGRVYLVAAVTAASLATLFVLLYRTSRFDIYEDVGNVMFGVAMLTCAGQSYRHVKFTKNIEAHQWWSYRLFAVVLGTVLYRLYVTVYFGLILFTPYQGTRWIFEATFFCFVLPNLLVVQVYRNLARSTTEASIEEGVTTTETSRGKFWYSSTLFWACTAFLATTTTAIMLGNWAPSVWGLDVGQADAIEAAYVAG